jgi:hypothetical protein
MRFYHRTTAANAAGILRHGFRDGTDTHMTDHVFSGVWLSAEPFDANDGTSTLLAVDLNLEQALIDEYEWIEEGKTRREWLIPSALLNSNASVGLAMEE